MGRKQADNSIQLQTCATFHKNGKMLQREEPKDQSFLTTPVTNQGVLKFILLDFTMAIDPLMTPLHTAAPPSLSFQIVILIVVILYLHHVMLVV